jgi:hypothetical protein
MTNMSLNFKEPFFKVPKKYSNCDCMTQKDNTVTIIGFVQLYNIV